MQSLRISGGRIDAVSFQATLLLIEERVRKKKFAHVLTVNPLMLGEAGKDPGLQKIFAEAAVAVPESVGIAALARWKGLKISGRVPGIDLMLDLCRRGSLQGWGIYLVGGRPEVAREAGHKLLQRFPGLKILGAHNGYFNPQEETKLLEDIRMQKPSLLFVGLSVPGQEKWIHRNQAFFPETVAMGVGGSLDVISERLRRAPQWMRDGGLEWLFRTFQEPFRIQRVLRIPFILLCAFFSKSLIERTDSSTSSRV